MHRLLSRRSDRVLGLTGAIPRPRRASSEIESDKDS